MTANPVAPGHGVKQYAVATDVMDLNDNHRDLSVQGELLRDALRQVHSPEIQNPTFAINRMQAKWQNGRLSRVTFSARGRDYRQWRAARIDSQDRRCSAAERTVYIIGFSKNVATQVLWFVRDPVGLLERAVRATTWNIPSIMTTLVGNRMQDGNSG